jgi:hypothetical protein
MQGFLGEIEEYWQYWVVRERDLKLQYASGWGQRIFFRESLAPLVDIGFSARFMRTNPQG